MHACMDVWMDVCMYTCVHAVIMLMFEFTKICISFPDIYIYIYMFICIHIYIYIDLYCEYVHACVQARK